MQKVTDKDFSEHKADYHIHGYSACEDNSRRLANILFNNYRSASTPKLGKESKQKNYRAVVNFFLLVLFSFVFDSLLRVFI